jgi:hypothetical protein
MVPTVAVDSAHVKHDRHTASGAVRTSGATTLLRAVLAAAAVPLTVVGAWALVAPSSFYADFPGVTAWVALLPPYNEHLTTDVGGLQLGFAVLFWWAVARPSAALVRPLAVATLVWTAAHLAFHVTHLDGFGTADAVAQSLALAGQLGLPALALVLVSKESS